MSRCCAAVNLSADAQLKMDDLRRIAGELGLGSARTYIASGNLLFSSDEPEAAPKANAGEGASGEHMGARRVGDGPHRRRNGAAR